MEQAKISIFGVQELDDFFQEMSRADQRRIMTDSWRIGTKPLITLAKQYIKSRTKKGGTGNLHKSIGFVPGRSRGKSIFVSAKVGARKFGGYKGFHGHLFDAGTSERQTKQGYGRGRMPATNFFTEALNQTESSIMDDSDNYTLAALDKLIQRHLKKQGREQQL